jgi:hypothetical protein
LQFSPRPGPSQQVLASPRVQVIKFSSFCATSMMFTFFVAGYCLRGQSTSNFSSSEQVQEIGAVNSV